MANYSRKSISVEGRAEISIDNGKLAIVFFDENGSQINAENPLVFARDTIQIKNIHLLLGFDETEFNEYKETISNFSPAFSSFANLPESQDGDGDDNPIHKPKAGELAVNSLVDDNPIHKPKSDELEVESLDGDDNPIHKPKSDESQDESPLAAPQDGDGDDNPIHKP